MSLPAQNASPAPCQSTTRIASSLSASLRMSARLVYMLDVIAFFWAGRLSWTRRIAPEGSVVMEDLFGVFAEVGRAPCRHLGDAMHLNRAADRRGQLAAGAFERNHDVICRQLGIVDHLLWPAHGAERDVHVAENLIPMLHRLRGENFIEDGRELWHVRHQLCRIGEPRIG